MDPFPVKIIESILCFCMVECTSMNCVVHFEGPLLNCNGVSLPRKAHVMVGVEGLAKDVHSKSLQEDRTLIAVVVGLCKPENVCKC